MESIEFVITVLSSLCALIAMAVKLCRIIAALADEKKYSELFEIISAAMIEAEEIAALSGEEKKARVIEAAEAAADELGIHSFDAERISDLIEAVIKITKKVNSH